MSALMDHLERERFVSEQGKNISVIAPAGVGKTYAIVQRILYLARLPEAETVDRLSRLVVVTYSVRAAQQMQQRARAALRGEKISPRVHRAFQQTFFGTIHSYCVRLLDRFGHYLGLPSSVSLLQAEEESWNRFLLRGLGQGNQSRENLHDLFHFYIPGKLYALGKEISPGAEIEVEPLPELNWREVLDYRDDTLHAATKKSIVRAQEALQQWSEAWARGDRFRSLPAYPTSEKAVEFAELWKKALAPLHGWLRQAALAFGRNVANDYEAFRLSEAVMTYDDQVRMALRVLDHPSVRRELAADRISVLLDEAQDTDPRQFEVLLRIAGLRDSEQAPDQSFCIVGDFQQAIYAPRSDLAVYRRVHDEISAPPRGTVSRLQVTFRCDRAIIDYVNHIFPSILNGRGGQCEFVPLVPREDAGPGQVVRWPCPDAPVAKDGKPLKAEARARHEAQFLAQQIKALGPKGFGASDWSQVAILCPRKNWLLEIQRELAALDLPVQLHSSNERQRDRTPGAWLTALIWIAAHPEDSFEIAGVLREIFGISDDAMATYTGGDGDRLRLDRFVLLSESPIEAVLQILREITAKADTLPLHELVRKIVEKSWLRERIHSIPDLALENVDQELDDLLSLIYGRCAQGATLAKLADELRQGLDQVFPAEEEVRDAIQLLTSHKAKGLEWQAVLVPYGFRTIESKALSYPRLVQNAAGEEIVCRDKVDFAEVRDFVTERDRQQLQRLLYVMNTRAKRTLVFVDDEALFEGQRPRPGWSAGQLLSYTGGENRIAWKALPETLSKLPAIEPSAISVSSFESVLPDIFKRDLAQAFQHAKDIPRRLTPHVLAIHPPPEAEPEKKRDRDDDQSTGAIRNPGTLYGTWWHEFMETIPWQQPDLWEKRFAEALARSPQPDRSRHEWELFRNSSLARWLVKPGRIIQVEMPFLWLESDQSCIEGVMDLAVYTESESSWRVIDWKTNRLDPANGMALVEVYRGQIQAYVQVLREMLKAEVRGSLYLTQSGDWIKID